MRANERASEREKKKERKKVKKRVHNKKMIFDCLSIDRQLNYKSESLEKLRNQKFLIVN